MKLLLVCHTTLRKVYVICRAMLAIEQENNYVRQKNYHFYFAGYTNL